MSDPMPQPQVERRLDGVSPTEGPSQGGTPVVLAGAGFGGAVRVTFGGGAAGADASGFGIPNANQIVCNAPRSWGPQGDFSNRSVDVAVHWSDGTSLVLPGAFAYRGWVSDDTLVSQQWHIENRAQYANLIAGEDARVLGAWAKEFTGAGVRVGILDDGIEILHEDLADNIVAGSHDYVDGDSDPTRGEHGTAVAGLIAARGGNALGCAGVAPGASLFGLAIDYTSVADMADAWGRDLATHFVSSNSWSTYPHDPPDTTIVRRYGFLDNGMYTACLQGLDTGRGGLGTIYVKSAGNFRAEGQLAGHDQRHGLPIVVVGGVGSDGEAYVGSQHGPSVLVCAPTAKGVSGYPGVRTTDRSGSAGYTSDNYSWFGGTSASCPIVSGVVALMLEAKPSLHWIDVFYLLGMTARRNHESDASWTQNGAGRWTSDAYGFGVVHADAAVTAASDFVPPATPGEVTLEDSTDTAIPDNDATGITKTFVVTDGHAPVVLARVEVLMSHSFLGDLRFELTSPSGTTSRLIEPSSTVRQGGTGGTLYFMTCRCLGESSGGTWTLRVSDRIAGDTGSLHNVKLILAGYK